MFLGWMLRKMGQSNLSYRRSINRKTKTIRISSERLTRLKHQLLVGNVLCPKCAFLTICNSCHRERILMMNE